VPKPLGDGQYEVVFTFAAPPGTKAVYLAGTFNDWKPTGLAMQGPDDEGAFNTRLVLAEGVYEYKFVVEGKDWHADPRNLHQAGPYGNSLLWVGKKH
jgi:1,4-alpha-glucan branching enzyme